MSLATSNECSPAAKREMLVLLNFKQLLVNNGLLLSLSRDRLVKNLLCLVVRALKPTISHGTAPEYLVTWILKLRLLRLLSGTVQVASGLLQICNLGVEFFLLCKNTFPETNEKLKVVVVSGQNMGCESTNQTHLRSIPLVSALSSPHAVRNSLMAASSFFLSVHVTIAFAA